MPRPSHATVVAYLALFVALGGTATALKGKNRVFSDDIRNGQVKAPDLARNAVKRGKIAARSVNARRLTPRAVTTSRLVPGAVTNQILAGDAVTAEKIADGGVGASDIRARAVGSGKIKKQAVGSGKLKPGAVTESKLAASVLTATGPIAPGLGRPVLEFVRSAAVPIGSSVAVLRVPGFGSYSGVCSVGGASVAYRNQGDSQQVAFVDDGSATSVQSVAPSASGAATAAANAAHVTVFSHQPTGGRSAHAEVFATHDPGPGCVFYGWAISR